MYTPVHTRMTHTNMHTRTHTHTHTHTPHTHTHTHTETGLVPLAVTLGSYFSHCIHTACTCARTHLHCYVNSPYIIFVTHTHKHTHAHTHKHTHAHAHTQTGLVLLADTLGSYFSHCLYKA